MSKATSTRSMLGVVSDSIAVTKKWPRSSAEKDLMMVATSVIDGLRELRSHAIGDRAAARRESIATGNTPKLEIDQHPGRGGAGATGQLNMDSLPRILMDAGKPGTFYSHQKKSMESRTSGRTTKTVVHTVTLITEEDAPSTSESGSGRLSASGGGMEEQDNPGDLPGQTLQPL